MENLVFIVTALACAVIAFVTKCDRKTKSTEKLNFNEKIMEAIQTYVEPKLQQFKQEMLQLKKQEQMINCILFTSVNINEEIQQIHVKPYVQITYNDIQVFDWNGERKVLKIEDNPMEMEIDFEVSSNFKYMEFTGLRIPSNLAKKWKMSAYVTFVTSDKSIICTAKISEKKNKIYNTAFLSALLSA